MNTAKIARLFFIDSNKEWLDFVMTTLAEEERYYVKVAHDFSMLDELSKNDFDLVFISVNFVEDNLESLSNIAKTRYLVVLFPGSPDGKTQRVYLRAGMGDLLSKPYNPQALKNTIEEQLVYAEKHSSRQQLDELQLSTYRKRVSDFQKAISISKLKAS